jgi:hypothetical protein
MVTGRSRGIPLHYIAFSGKALQSLSGVTVFRWTVLGCSTAYGTFLK